MVGVVYICSINNEAMINKDWHDEGKTLFLRFTDNPQQDVAHGCSVWCDYEHTSEADKPADFHQFDYVFIDGIGWCKKHQGLSGHALQSATLGEALAEVAQGVWFGNQKRDHFAIFVGAYSKNKPGRVWTPEGDDFDPAQVIYFK